MIQQFTTADGIAKVRAWSQDQKQTKRERDHTVTEV